MTEAEKIALSEPLAEIFMSMEDDLLRAIAKQIAEGGEINASSEWRLLKLAQEGALTAEAVRIITKYLGSQDEELTRVIAAEALGVIDTLEPAFQQCALDGFVSDASEIPMSAMSAKIISTYRKQAATDLNLVNTVMMYKTGSRYKELVNKIYDEANRQDYLNILGKHTASVVTGAESRLAAVRNCIREFADKGIPAFVDKAGREWSPEAYINMDIRTTVSNTANAAQDAVCDRYGVDLIEVSSHMGARSKCAPYQGKIFSRSNQSGIAHDGNGREIRYEPLSSTSYGQPDGLFGINCRHQKYPFVDGVNFQTYFPYDEAENAKRYKEFQTQRAMERDIRKKKRECMMLEETGDTEALKAARADLRQSKKAYNAYSDEHGLRTREDRLRVERSKSAANSRVDKSGGSGIINIGSELPMNALMRKAKPDDYIEPMPKKQFQRICKSFRSKGGIIQMNDATDEYLRSKNAEAITYDGKTILFKQNPSRASVFEELIHTHQYKTGENDGSYESRLKCEISAQKKLIKYSKAYKLTEKEILQTKKALESYENELREYYKNGGA